MARRTSFVTAIVLLALSAVVHANGRAPVTNGIYFRANDSQSIFVRTTFGLLISRDDGCTFRWICEQNVGYGGTFDPKYAIATDGTLFATTFEGLRVSRDGGCSFTTATAELPAGAPGRIAEKWVDAIDIGPTGELWVATADSGKPNDIYRSTDNGVTFESRGMLSPSIWWKSVMVAPSDPLRVYASGYELTTLADGGNAPIAYVYSTTDGGQNWTAGSLTGVQNGFSPAIVIVAVDPTNPNIVYMISQQAVDGRGDRLYRSIDGGSSFTEVLSSPDPLGNVVVVNATTVIVTSAMHGSYRSDDGGATFGLVSGSPLLGCLGKRSDGTLMACAANWDPDFMAVGRSSDAAQWQKIFRFVELAGAVECPAGTTNHDVCDQEQWDVLRQQFGAKGPTCGAATDPPVDPKPKGSGCCDAGNGAPFGVGLLACGALFMIARPRRRFV